MNDSSDYKLTKDPLDLIKSNALIESSYRLTVQEQRLILACIAQISPGEIITDEKCYSVSANALSDISGLSANSAYLSLKEAVNQLFKREVWISKDYKTNHPLPKKLRIRWVQEVAYIDNEARAELRFSKSILPHISDLKGNFTKLKLLAQTRMSSAHSMRIYELLMQWRQVGEREVLIDDLKTMLSIEGKYTAIKDFKKYVIEQAQKEINEITNLNLEVGYGKTGRRVTSVQFKFEPKSNTKIPISKEEFKTFATKGESLRDAIQRAKEAGYRFTFNPYELESKAIPAASSQAQEKEKEANSAEVHPALARLGEHLNPFLASLTKSDREEFDRINKGELHLTTHHTGLMNGYLETLTDKEIG